MAYRVHVVSHTHWDREWYQPLGRFRQRLVALIDDLLDAPPEPGQSFLLDGQAVVLLDYLEVRPERREDLARLLRDGRLEAGPWFVLADNLIPSGEAIVRNLLAGRRIVRSLGGAPPPVLYAPDTFGHPAALPLIAAGFGFSVGIVWRGYGSSRWPTGDAFNWKFASGESVLVHHLPPDGYEFGANLPTEPAAATERWQSLRSVLADRARSNVLLVQNGADHHARQLNLAGALASLSQAAQSDVVIPSSLAKWANDFETQVPDAPEVIGELRDSYGYTWTLQGTFSTRAAQKRRNAIVERELVRRSEPWSALAHRLGEFDLQPGVNAVWRTLLEVHPHDTLCGCSSDEVARAADVRLDSALAQAEGITRDSMYALIGHDVDRARARVPMWRSALVVSNPVPRARRGVAEVELLVKLQDVPVGPGSARQSARIRNAGALDVDGGAIPVQVLGTTQRHDRIEALRFYPDDDLVESRKAVVWIDDAIGGYATRSLSMERGRRVREPRIPRPVTTRGLRLENGVVSLSVDPKGRVTLSSGDVEVDDVLVLEHVADRGDLYTHSPVGKTASTAQLRGQRLVHRGPIRAMIEQQWSLRVPSALGSRRPVDMPIVIQWIVDAESPFVRLHIRGDNTARDHRVRIGVRSRIASPVVVADAAFGPVVRESIDVSAKDLEMERPPATAPLHRYVSLFDDARGFTLVSDGLAEYEAADDGTCCVTLVRGVGELSRIDLPERPGHAGWPTSTPEAQSLGAFEANLAVALHEARTPSTIAAIESMAEDVLTPIAGFTLRSALRLPPPTEGITLAGEGLAFSALKIASDGEHTVLRCVNLLDAPVHGEWWLPWTPVAATLARLDETGLEPLPLDASVIHFAAPPRAAVTILVR